MAASKTTMLLNNPTDNYLGLIVLVMFFAGIVLAYREVVRWWKARIEKRRGRKHVHTRIIGYRCTSSYGATKG